MLPDVATLQRQLVEVYEGRHGPAVLARAQSYLGAHRARQMGAPDLSRNPLRTYVRRLAAFHVPPPLVSGTDEALHAALGDWPALPTVRRYQAAGGLPMATDQQAVSRRACEYWLAAGLAAVSLRPVGDQPDRVSLSVVRPTELQPEYGLDDPREPVRLGVRHQRLIGGEVRAVVGRYDLRDPDRPRYAVESEQGEELEVWEGGDYPYRYPDGRPLLPVVLIGRPEEAIGLAGLRELSLLVAVDWGCWHSAVTDAGHPQRWLVGGTIAGGESASGSDAAGVPLGPADVAVIQQTGEHEPRVGQWGPGYDPAGMAQAIREYEASGLQLLGLPVSLERTGGEPTAQEEARRRELVAALLPEVRRLDSEVLRRAAALLGRDVRPGVAYLDEVGDLLAPASATSPSSAPATGQETP